MTENGAAVTSSSLPLILDGNFFKVVSEQGTKVVGQCTLCPSKIMGLKTTTSNFNTHLKKMHPDRHKVYEEYKILKGQTIKKRRMSRGNISPNGTADVPRRRRSTNGSPRNTNSNGIPGPGRGRPKSNFSEQLGMPPRRQSLNPQQHLMPRRRSKQLTQHAGLSLLSYSSLITIRSRKQEIDEMVFNYIVQSINSPSIVESPHFINLVNGLSATSKKLVSQKSVQTRITMQAIVQRSDIARILSNVDLVCVTVDVWALACDAGNTFIAMTAHWIANDLKIQSVLLSCRRFHEDLAYSKVVGVVSQILALYSIPNEKICCLVTNTGSNHLPTRIYQIQHLDDENSLERECEDLCNDDLSFVNLSNILSQTTDDGESDPEKTPRLPSHYDCPTQTLIGVLTNSVFEALSNTDRPTSYMFQSSVAKCQALWKECTNIDTVRKIQDAYGVTILTPNKLNWNSFLEAIMNLLSSKQVVDQVFPLLDLPLLEENEWEFLEEYVLAMTPVTKALIVLQDEHDLYMGSFAPTILTVKTKLEEMITDEEPLVDLAKPIVDALLNGLNRPFADIIELNESARPLILASIFHPFFKLRWVPQDKIDELKGWYLEVAMNYAKQIEEEGRNPNSESEGSRKRGRAQAHHDSGSGDNEFAPFSSGQEGDDDEGDDMSTSILLEFIQYLDIPCEKIESGQLERFPNVKKFFITYNTAIASSVPVDRLIKFPEISQAPSSAVLTDEVLENMLLLKCN